MRKSFLAFFSAAALALQPPCPARDLPFGAQIRHGSLDISTHGHAMRIDQQSPSAIVNWESFDIGRGFAVEIHQPSRLATMLARVTGPSPSELHGQLTANGGFYLVNPAGILFGSGAVIDVNRLLATTRDLADEAFLAGRLEFTGNSSAAVINHGQLNAEAVALLAGIVENHGTITAPQSALLGAGQVIRLQNFGNGGSLAIDFSELDSNFHTTVVNDGVLNSSGGTAALAAGGGAGDLQAASGSVSAHSVEFSGRNAALSRLGEVNAEELLIDPTANLVIGAEPARDSGLGYVLAALNAGSDELEIPVSETQPEFTAGVGYGFHDQDGNGWTYLRREANTLGGQLESYSYFDPILTYYHDDYLNSQLETHAITLKYTRRGTADGAITVAQGATLGGNHPLALIAEADLTLAEGINATNSTALTFEAGHNLAANALSTPASLTLIAGNRLDCGTLTGREICLAAGQEITLTQGAAATEGSLTASGETMRITGEVSANQNLKFNFEHLLSNGPVNLEAQENLAVKGDWLADQNGLGLATAHGDIDIQGTLREAKELAILGGHDVKLDTSSLLQSNYVYIQATGGILGHGEIQAASALEAIAGDRLVSTGTLLTPEASFTAGGNMQLSDTKMTSVKKLMVGNHGDAVQISLDWQQDLERLELITTGSRSDASAQVGTLESALLLAEGSGSSLNLSGQTVNLERAETFAGDLTLAGTNALTLGSALSRQAGKVSVASGTDLVVREILSSADDLAVTAGGRIVLAGQEKLSAGRNLYLTAMDFDYARNPFRIAAGGKLYLSAAPGTALSPLFALLEGPTRDHAIHPRDTGLPGTVIYHGRVWMGTPAQMAAVGRAESELFARVCAALREIK
ncbi:MAG: filamentous hemagglutinin N-terminal domain-containing protein [Victivallales bacterium]|nr:filamentous hemagglutinin N-terminal domain-containing protein [Victivallales bacterium]